MSEAEPRQLYPYRSAQLREGHRRSLIVGHVVTHIIAVLGVFASGVLAAAVGLRPATLLLIFGACAVWILWAVPYAIYLACRGRRSWLSARRHFAASIVWILAIGVAVCASAGDDKRRLNAEQRALDALVRTTAQATRRYRADHGQYPETLSALVPQYLPRVPVAEPPIAYRLTCPIDYRVWHGVATMWIPGRDPMFDNCIHRRGVGFDLSTGRQLPR